MVIRRRFNQRKKADHPLWAWVGGLLLALLLWGGLSLTVPNSTAAQETASEELRVVTKPLEPMVMITGNQFQGFSIDLWNEVARRMGIQYRWITVETVTEQLKAVEQGTADVAIAGISMTPEREELIDFSYPYLDAGLQIMTAVPQGPTVLSSLRQLLSVDLLKIITALLLFLLAIAHVVWGFDRLTQSKNYSAQYIQGIGETFWWSAVTLATGGYGDDAPRGPFRRFIVLIWMFTGIVLISNFTAAITTQNTLEGLRGDINGLNDLAGKRVMVVDGSTASRYLTEQGIQYRTIQDIRNAYPLLENGKIQAIVYDSPVLQHYASTQGRGKVHLVTPIIKPEFYGIALPQGSPYREDINRTLLEIKLDGTHQRLHDQWFMTREAGAS